MKIILHVPICFERNDLELDLLYRNLQQQHKNVDTIIVSVNGKHTDEILNTLTDFADEFENMSFFCRHNFGYQWGGYYDVWKAYKGYDWYVTMEVDVTLVYDWVAQCLATGSEHIGQTPLLHYTIFKDYKLQPREKEHKTITASRYKNIKVTAGGFHMCSADLLNKIDNKFHRFTDSWGSDHLIDGVLKGEFEFCEKVEAVGQTLYPLVIYSQG